MNYKELLEKHPDLPMFDLCELLKSNKSKDYQEQVILSAKVLSKFLANNNLLIGYNPFEENGELKKDLLIEVRHLTEEGVELFRKPVNNWYKAHDRGTPIEKITILEKGLKKIRESKS